MARVPHLRVPLEVEGGALAVLEQDSPEEIEQCVESLLRTEIGQRIDEPGYGRPDDLFTQQDASRLSAEEYVAAIADWESRARVLGEAALEELRKRVTIRPEGE